ncbi:hypothetical protein [Pseudomonas sp. Fl4BN1]|uniref:hypothetical protein n=1 Tax=Pseudomonas sp. Fl4BN1 TaxID=2697651 RepID=UPI001376599D|nr:hypothetical protein [Pseudomonas sp. Fl4BN1]NBF09200.1 hypothetical protein [Pseudomonas sp. Fl4BN1]
MNILIFEVSIRKELHIGEISAALKFFFELPDLNILSADAFWELSEVEQEMSIGIRLEYNGVGYRTLAIFYCCFDVFDEILAGFAKYLAESFGTEVAIGDYLHKADVVNDRFVVFQADGSRKFGFEKGDSDGFDIDVVD